MSTPEIYYSHGDFETGRKVVIMKDLAHLKQAGVFFGPGNPGNWGKQLEANLEEQVCRSAFKEAAKLHAANWKNKELLNHEWLRSTRWVKGLDETIWEERKHDIINFNSKMQANSEKVVYD